MNDCAAASVSACRGVARAPTSETASSVFPCPGSNACSAPSPIAASSVSNTTMMLLGPRASMSASAFERICDTGAAADAADAMWSSATQRPFARRVKSAVLMSRGDESIAVG